jgi:type VI secretion system protein ImpE
MNASDLFKAGQLQEAIDAQLKEVKAKPADHGQRLFLFELLCFAGDLERAQRQIDVVNYGEMELDAAVATYRRLVDSERARRRLFSESLLPRFFGNQPEHIHLRLEAVNRLRENRPEQAAELLSKANAMVPDLKGELNGKPFQSLRDCDDLFAFALEVFAQGEYYWVPLEQVESLTMIPPKAPRDLLWASARLEMKESAGNVHLPALYPGSHEHADNQVKLGRMTDWKTAERGPVLGAGARVFLVNEETESLLEWRQLQVAN